MARSLDARARADVFEGNAALAIQILCDQPGSRAILSQMSPDLLEKIKVQTVDSAGDEQKEAVRPVDAWGNPILIVFPGRQRLDGEGGFSAIRFDEDGTVRTKAEQVLGPASNRYALRLGRSRRQVRQHRFRRVQSQGLGEQSGRHDFGTSRRSTTSIHTRCTMVSSVSRATTRWLHAHRAVGGRGHHQSLATLTLTAYRALAKDARISLATNTLRGAPQSARASAIELNKRTMLVFRPW